LRRKLMKRLILTLNVMI